ncbi:MAG: CooT family nickel-binding protein [Deltaproteobacteria bacterium]|nr:CooT family nickel-binding protein [Deltaproteobacteria bacterium]
MCESTAYLLVNGQEEMVLESVDGFESEGDQIRLVNIFGEEKKIKARIKSLSLVEHKIILEP